MCQCQNWWTLLPWHDRHWILSPDTWAEPVWAWGWSWRSAMIEFLCLLQFRPSLCLGAVLEQRPAVCVYLETAAMEQRWEASYSSAGGGGYPPHDKWSLAAVFTILLLCCYSLHRLIESCPRTLGRRRRDEEQTQNLTWRNRLLIMNRKNSACCFRLSALCWLHRPGKLILFQINFQLMFFVRPV